MTDRNKYSGVGLETTEGLSQTLPFLQIIQSNSPEIKRSHEQYDNRKIEGASEGDIVFLPEKILFKQEEGVKVIPLAFKNVYTEWRPKDSGGGFIGLQPLSVSTMSGYEKDGVIERLNGNELINTIYVALLFETNGEWKDGVVAFTSTQLKKARAWSKMITGFRYSDSPGTAPPIFACTFRVKTEMESNDRGNWFGWKIISEGPIEDEALLDEAFGACNRAKAELPNPTAEQKALPASQEEDEMF